MSRKPATHAVVLAGGAGTRFWPLSRRALPKQLLSVGGGQTLLGATLERARRFAAPENIWLVCGAEHARAVRRAADLPASRVLVEPQMRNTAAAVAFATARILREDPEAVMAVLPADHSIPDQRAFAAAIRRAARAAADGAGLVTLGVRPTRADTGLGYIRLGRDLPRHRGLHRVGRFVEKPERDRARRYWRSGRYLWNMGVFVWQARIIAEELERHAPAIAQAVLPLGDSPRRRLTADVARAYERVPAHPVDKAVLERSDRVACLPVDFHWSDVGSWQSLAEELGVTGNVTKIMEGEVVLNDSPGNLVHTSGRPVALLGVSGLVVIDAGDALLVADLEKSHEVRELVEELRRRGRSELL